MAVNPNAVALKPDEKQLVALALAHLEVERPGWGLMLAQVAERLYIEPDTYMRFKALHEAHVNRPDAGNDSIVQLRAVVERANPLLWAMVREIAWPGGRE